MDFDNSWVYIAFAFLTALTFLLIVPKEKYKHYLLFGIVFGGVGDILAVIVLTWLNLIKYKNMGYFNILNLFSSWTPISWTLAFGLFLYLLPIKKKFLLPYVLSWAAFTYGIGLVFQNFGIFEYKGYWDYGAPFLFMSWFSVTAWYYIHYNKITVQ